MSENHNHPRLKSSKAGTFLAAAVWGGQWGGHICHWAHLDGTTAHQYPTLPILIGYVLPVVMKSLFHGTGSVPMVVGYLPLLARLSGTLCPRTCGIRMFLRTVTGSRGRRFYFRSTSVFSALEVFTRMRYISLHLTLTLAMRFHAVNTAVVQPCYLATNFIGGHRGPAL